MRSFLRATRVRVAAGAIAFVALFAVVGASGSPAGDIGWPVPPKGATVAGDIGWPSPVAPATAARTDIGWPVKGA
ncbi:hypothetical protein OG730_05845 [Streptomyces sp. NBC_01298]|uniref:hypothetical protein n=1 Tax=Streptomyces sp. NBC_01298 TaxID=2903817 RepID=UPI002E12B16F|nr:hypothetical protein OG730_05845 [Streptomyces sp. NBC_01298]